MAGSETLSRRHTRSSKASKEAAGEVKAISLVDGQLSFRVRKRRQETLVAKVPGIAKEPPGLVTSQLGTPVAVDLVKAPTAVVDAVNAPVRRTARLKRAAEEQTLAADLPKSRSNARRESGNVPAKPTPLPSEIDLLAPSSVVLQEQIADFWHSSLSESSGASLIKESIVTTQAATLPIKTLFAPEDVVVAIEHLKAADPLLKTVIDVHDGPKFEKCRSAFTALARSITFQQLATKVASIIFGRLVTLCKGLDNLTPITVSRLSVEELRAIGISGRKASYLHDLASNFLSGALSDSSISTMDDEALMAALTAVKGIGVWSVHMFMLFSLHRPDVLPVGDLGVRKGLQKLYQLKNLPTPAEVERIASSWQPYRSLGAWYMWRVIQNTSLETR